MGEPSRSHRESGDVSVGSSSIKPHFKWAEWGGNRRNTRLWRKDINHQVAEPSLQEKRKWRNKCKPSSTGYGETVRW